MLLYDKEEDFYILQILKIQLLRQTVSFCFSVKLFTAFHLISMRIGIPLLSYKRGNLFAAAAKGQ